MKQLAASGPEGRSQLEDLLRHPRPDFRLRAAQAVVEWAPDKAIPVYARLLIEDLPDISADERCEIATSAIHGLFQYFGVTSWDQNDLIEPLRAYGVDLPYEDHTLWQ